MAPRAVDEHSSKFADFAEGAKNSGPLKLKGDFKPLSHLAAEDAPDNPRAVVGGNGPPSPVDIPEGVVVIHTAVGPCADRRNAGLYWQKKFGFGSASSLAHHAMLGTGPKYYKPAKRAIYPLGESFDGWALEQLGEPRTTFSDNDDKVA